MGGESNSVVEASKCYEYIHLSWTDSEEPRGVQLLTTPQIVPKSWSKKQASHIRLIPDHWSLVTGHWSGINLTNIHLHTLVINSQS